jgi:hypothetical protein
MSFRTGMIVSGAVGAAAGFVVAFFDVSISSSLISWWLLGVALGHFTQDRRSAVYSGAVYGTLLAASFIAFEIGFTHTGIIEYILLFLLMCIVGSSNGAAAEMAGLELKQRVKLGQIYEYVHDRYERIYSRKRI